MDAVGSVGVDTNAMCCEPVFASSGIKQPQNNPIGELAAWGFFA